MRLLPLLLFLSACAAPSGAYMDGATLAPPEPRVTYTPTGAGLPEYWGTPEAPKVERSPHTRELPPTREPGLWAGDQPRASGSDVLPHLFGVTMPHALDKKDVALGLECAGALEVAAADIGLHERLASGSEALRACVAAQMFASCVNTITDRIAALLREQPSRELDDQHVFAERLKWNSLLYAESACKNIDVPDDMWKDMADAETEAASFIKASHTRRLH